MAAAPPARPSPAVAKPSSSSPNLVGQGLGVSSSRAAAPLIDSGDPFAAFSGVPGATQPAPAQPRTLASSTPGSSLANLLDLDEPLGTAGGQAVHGRRREPMLPVGIHHIPCLRVCLDAACHS